MFWTFIGPSLVVMSVIPVLQNWFLGYWSSQYDLNPGVKPPVKLLVQRVTPLTLLKFCSYLVIYGLILLSDIIVTSLGQVVFILGVVRASRSLHARLMSSVLSSTFR